MSAAEAVAPLPGANTVAGAVMAALPSGSPAGPGTNGAGVAGPCTPRPATIAPTCQPSGKQKGGNPAPHPTSHTPPACPRGVG